MMLKLRYVYTLLLLLFVYADAVSAPHTAADWLKMARWRQGSTALDQLKTVHQISVINVPKKAEDTESSPLPITDELWVDLTHGYIKDAVSQGGKVISIRVKNASGSFYYAPEAGLVPLPQAERDDLERSLSRGILALRLPLNGWDGVDLLGTQNWQGVKGTALSLTRGGLTETLLLGGDGTLLGDQGPALDIGEVTVLNSDFRRIGGLLTPMSGNGYLKPEIHFSEMRVQSMEYNLPLTLTDFEVPQ